METRDFLNLFAFDHWANGRALASLEVLADPPAKAVELLGHLLGAQECWISRMTRGREPDELERWERMDLAALRRGWESELPAMWSAFFADATASDLARSFTFVNFLGDTRQGRVEHALCQLLFHSPHHRGQIATLVRASGGEPASTNFGDGVRAGAVA